MVLVFIKFRKIDITFLFVFIFILSIGLKHFYKKDSVCSTLQLSQKKAPNKIFNQRKKDSSSLFIPTNKRLAKKEVKNRSFIFLLSKGKFVYQFDLKIQIKFSQCRFSYYPNLRSHPRAPPYMFLN